MQVPFPYFYPPNGTKTQHFPASHSSSSDAKLFMKHSTASPENSSSPINFSSRTESLGESDFKQDGFRHRSMSNENQNRNHADDENVEVD